MRSLAGIASFLFSCAVVFCAAIISYSLIKYAGLGPLPEKTAVMVESGAGVAAIAKSLEEQHVISSALLLRAASRMTGSDTAIKAGEYEFEAHVSMKDVLAKLADGDVLQRRITVPEGHTSWQVVQILNGIDTLAGTLDTIPAEGSLLPETYTYMRGEQRSAVIARMQAAQQKVIEELWEGRDKSIAVLSPAEAINLAAIVEKETGVAAERPRIAGVFMNRLRLGMMLQTDPTVIYGLTEGKIQDAGKGPLGRRLTTKDLQTPSPWNTYMQPGLPPGPIANPGRDAIKAVLNPEAHEFIFFVADGTGGHVFAKTLEEHNKNVANWRQIRKQSGN